ncbi:glycerol-3-phosphate dehydrogenase/oxidase [Dactylosporangium sp. AC04546]|uniref:glycerol-3-phosphate dehydrogenase/oxidase n=1 Tax=Dactylosporangium sp. AC04546 TaxID=2862460 RepID=UPI001EE0D317|nr:glycerol-3-phosphate dehydrogenase/oxidase [Dactylosporangium sp. AC04546]WVK87954.1 glycerol-3-phosphate dehydrogenase/oxidase [Dactylosporangium sp. AC04546]
MHTAPLSPSARSTAIATMESTELDVVVVGGGVVGAGCALDATTRGLSTGLLEMRDWASGTSSRSSKLIHGGLRYLEMLDFHLVREALRERSLLLHRLAPHLVRPVPFIYPLTRPLWERFYVGSGITLYDGMAGRGMPRHRQLSRREALRLCPALRRDSLVGAVQYWDAQVDDARHTMFVARTAAAYGAHVVSRAQVVGFLREAGRITGVRVRDLEDDRTFEVRARQVINATGVWTDETQALIGERGQFQVRASKGVHLVVPRDRIQSTSALILRTPTSVLFVIPWGRHWIVGTTDTDWTLDKSHPAATRSDIDYLLGEVNKVLVSPLRPEDVEGVYAGLRPLLAGESELTSKLSREHVVATPVPGLVAVAGGKYTTYRVMAADAVDAAAHSLGGAIPPSCTDKIPLLGADGFPALWNQRAALSNSSGLHVARMERLLRRYGTLVDEVLDLIRADPSLADPLDGAEDYLQAEVAYAVLAEGARHVEDVLTRRTRASIETFDRGLTALVPVARLMANLLDWPGEQLDRELASYRHRVEAERASQDQPDDRAADLTRREAPDVVPVAHA